MKDGRQSLRGKLDRARRINCVGAAGFEPGDDDVVRVQHRARLTRV